MPKMMLLGMDYDSTYTADPDGWDAMIAFFRGRGHEFVCVTGRSEPPALDRRQIPMPVVCAGSGCFKREAAERAGYRVDVWIDDAPGFIEQARVLTW